MPDNTAVALVIGAGDGTGAAIARAFASADMTVCLARRNAEALAPALQQIRDSGGECSRAT